MIFLIEFDRPTQTTLRFKTFDDTEVSVARQERFQIELQRNREGLLMQREIVLFQGKSEATLRHTHDRYFEKMSPDARTPLVEQTV